MFLLIVTLLLSQPETVPMADHRPQAEKLARLLAAGDHTAVVAAFDDTMRKALPAAKVTLAWQGATKPLGPWQDVDHMRVENAGKYQVVHVICRFADGKLDSKFVFTSDGKVAGWFLLPAEAYAPPGYVKSESFAEVPVEIGKGKFLMTLPGTLTLPKSNHQHPVILLVHGSGPHDRDETIGPNKPFRDLAQGLASRGIAVLRYEKRTKHHPVAMSLNAKLTVKEETIDDVLAAVELLAAHKQIDGKQIFVLGHSLGGMLIPRIAERSDRIAGYISLAGSARPLEELVLEQTKYLLERDGLSEDDKKQLELVAEQVQLVQSDQLTLQTPAKNLPLGIPAAYWLDLRGYQPQAAAQAIKSPLLILQGERDYQVTMADFALWTKALKDRDNVTLKSYPKLNHLFMPGEGESRPAEYLQANHISEEVIVDIERWLRAH